MIAKLFTECKQTKYNSVPVKACGVGDLFRKISNRRK